MAEDCNQQPPELAQSPTARVPSNTVHEQALLRHIWQAFGHLPKLCRHVAVLHYIDGCDEDEIGSLLPLPVTRVQALLAQIHAALTPNTKAIAHRLRNLRPQVGFVARVMRAIETDERRLHL